MGHPENRRIRADYRLTRVITETASYRVSAARDSDGNQVTIHDIEFQAGTASAMRERLEYVAGRLAALSLEGYSTPIGCEFDQDGATIICPMIPGPTLAEQLILQPLTIDATLSLAEDLLISLTHLHRHDALHRCLRPDEIVFAGPLGDTRATITGLGFLSLFLGSSCNDLATITATYAAPESLGALEDTAQPSSDLYALGIVLFECLAGHLPFDADNGGDMLYQHMTAPVPSLTELRPEIPRCLDDLVQRLLRKDPKDRYQTADGVLHDVQRIRQLLEEDQPPNLTLGRKDRRYTLVEPSLTGREPQLQSIDQSLVEVASGNSKSWLLKASSGLGKTRLLKEAERVARVRGFRVLKAHGQSQPGLAPLAGLQTILRDCTQMVSEHDSLAFRLRLVANEFGRELRAVVPELMDALDLPRIGGGELSDRRIAFALATLLGSLGGEQPVMIILDDAQWFDELTCLMLESWKLTQPSQTLLLVAARDGSDNLAHYEPEVEMRLTPLDRDSLNELLESMAGPLPTDVLGTVWKRSKGSPFAASALLHGLVEAQVLLPGPAGWSADSDQLRDLRMSGEAGVALSERFSRLADESKRLLAVGAVLGTSFELAMTAELTGMATADAMRLLRVPLESHLLLEGSSRTEFMFAHDQVRQAAASLLTQEERENTHRLAAQYLVSRDPDRIFDISYHFDAGGDSELAQPYALRAAVSARGSHALQIAEEQYRIALRSFDAVGKEAPTSVLAGLGDVLMLAGRYADAEPLFERAVASADSATTRAEVTLKLGELAFKQDAKDRAIELWESALLSLQRKLPPGWLMPLYTVREIAVQAVQTVFPKRFVGRYQTQPTAEDRLAWKLYSRLAHGYWYVSTKAHVLYVHLRGMNQSERYIPTRELAQAYSEHAPAMTLLPWFKRGIAYGRKSFNIRSQQGDIWGQGQSLHFLAIALYAAGKFEECVDVGTRAVRILDRAGDYWEKHIAQYQVAASLYRLGRFTEAVRIAQAAYESGIAVGDFQACGNVAEVWARAADGALPPDILARELDRSRSDMQGVAHVRLAQGVQLISSNRYAEAIDALNEGIKAARTAGIDNTYTSPLAAWKATALRLLLESDPPLTKQNRRRMLRAHRRAARRAMLTAIRFRNELPHALREYALAQLASGRKSVAVYLLRKSLEVAEQQSAKYEVIQTSLVLHRVRRELGEPLADEQLRDAERRYAAFRTEHLPKSELASLSLADRFDKLLNSGRQIASAIEPRTIAEKTLTTARQLLRGDHCELVPINENDELPSEEGVIRQCVATAIEAREAVSAPVDGSAFRSLLGSPILVRGRTVACLVVANSEVSGLFGDNELRIANYITTIAGAAMENAEGFQKLHDLNTNLEQIVDERTAAVEARSRELQKTADDLRQTQTELAAARDAAEVANQAKTDFLAQMSHEIRTPIGAVLGFTELLLGDETKLQPQQLEYLERVHSNGNHLHNLLNDLLDLSRIEAGEMTIESLDCAPYPLLYDVLSALQSRAVSKGITLSLRVADRVPERIRTDPTRLRQIVTNLIGNAIKFTPEGSVSVIVDTDVPGEQLRIRVRDTGVGIPQSAIENVFEPFRQADESVTRNFGGTGLGLPISRQLARALGGDIDVESEDGVGSTFTICVATGALDDVRMLDGSEAEAEKQTSTKVTSAEVDLSGYRFLVADDTDANRQLFQHVLTGAGGTCDVVNNGQEAVDAVADREFDLVIMDMRMPVLDGYSATAQLREAGVTIPIVALTANGLEEDERKCLDAGCSAYLTKPISVANLLIGVAAELGLEVTQVAESVAPAEGQTAEPPANQAIAASPSQDYGNFELPEDPFFRELAVEFVGEVHDSLDALSAAVKADDRERLQQLSHWIKGTGGTVGLDGFSAIGREIEDAVTSGDMDATVMLVGELSIATRRTLDSANART